MSGYAASRARRVAQRKRNLHVFAEMMAQGWTIAAAARSLKVSENTATRYMAQLREDLGPQAR